MHRQRHRKPGPDRGFTLIEILVVISIILLVSIIAIPVTWSALSGRQVTDAARIFTGALVGARDSAIKYNEPRGIRLMPDPNLTIPPPGTQNAGSIQLVYNRMLPIEPAGDISDGRINIGPVPIPDATFPPSYPVPNADGTYGVYPFPDVITGTARVLMVEESPYVGGYVTPNGAPNSPCDWFWTVRVGDKIKIGGTGRSYTVVGPCTINPAGPTAQTQGNPELYVNVGPPGQVSPLKRSYYDSAGNPFPPVRNPQFLFVVNGDDDNGNGWVDEGWDGVNQNPFPPPTAPLTGTGRSPQPTDDGIADNLIEWETETWVGAFPPVLVDPNVAPGVSPSALWALATAQHNIVDATYIIERRPVPTAGAREIALPAGTVIDATTWNSTAERSRLPIDPGSLTCDVMLTSNGRYIPTTVYSSPSSASQVPFLHFWLTDRKDVYPDGTLWGTSGTPALGNPNPSATSTTNPQFYRLPMTSDAMGPGPGGVLVSGGFYPPATSPTFPVLKGDRRLVTLFGQSGLIVVNTIETVVAPNATIPPEGFNVSDVNTPFYKAQAGQREAR